MSITEAKKKLLWAMRFLAFYRFYSYNQPISLYIANKEAILLIENLKFYQKTKHIKVC